MPTAHNNKIGDFAFKLSHESISDTPLQWRFHWSVDGGPILSHVETGLPGLNQY